MTNKKMSLNFFIWAALIATIVIILRYQERVTVVKQKSTQELARSTATDLDLEMPNSNYENSNIILMTESSQEQINTNDNIAYADHDHTANTQQ